ncbi:hypothetical protein EV132_108124 [Rhizobium sullae]|uniref:Secreted protein n=1 Tax=Rhizobium sullae TaxID=50338 RepID=A0A4R3Q2W7_RHISU|nr:hypothetical protein EV132_108124 [Rhizobium sullae]
MKRISILSIAAMSLSASLSGCTTTSPDGLVRYKARRSVVSGERTKIGAAWNLNPDCTAKTVPDVRVRQAPKHGKVENLRELAFPSATDEYEKCNGTKVPAVVGYYTSKQGFVGKDRIVVRTSYKDGNVDEQVLDIAVVK